VPNYNYDGDLQPIKSYRKVEPPRLERPQLRESEAPSFKDIMMLLGRSSCMHRMTGSSGRGGLRWVGADVAVRAVAEWQNGVPETVVKSGCALPSADLTFSR
jgi:hypothetical protein